MLCTALLVALAAAPAVAGEPQQRVRHTLDTVSAVLNDPQLQGSSNEREQRERVAKVMHESFDFRAMARESLGSHWAGLAPVRRAGRRGRRTGPAASMRPPASAAAAR